LFFNTFYQQSSVIVEDILVTLVKEDRLYNLAQESGIDYREVKSLLHKIKKYHEQTYQHSLNVARYSAMLSRKLRLSAIEIYTISIGALLHDVGKIFFPCRLLNKKAKLTKDEYQLIKKHPQIGVNMISHLDRREQLKQMVLLHHERFDGKGYYAVSKDKIPLSARIITIADAFDAMISPRPYQEQRNLCDSWMEIERCSGTQFDPDLLPGFLSMITDMGYVR